MRGALRTLGKAATPAEVARTFKGAQEKKVRELLEILATLGQVSEAEGLYSL